MSDFSYSTKALNISHNFYNKDFLLYVEGVDDKLFWRYLLEKSKVNKTFEIKDVGGSKIDSYAKKVFNENANFIVAMDLDYKKFLNTVKNHSKIIYTNGHSIENTLYCPQNINKVIEKLIKDTAEEVDFIDSWILNFSNDLLDLLAYDIANKKLEKSFKFLGDSCITFLKNNNSIELDTKKMESYLKSLIDNFSYSDIQVVKTEIIKQNMPLRYLIRGHFLTSAIVNLVKHLFRKRTGSKLNLPNDNFYALVIDGCKYCNCKCDDIESLTLKLKTAVENLK